MDPGPRRFPLYRQSTPGTGRIRLRRNDRRRNQLLRLGFRHRSCHSKIPEIMPRFQAFEQRGTRPSEIPPALKRKVETCPGRSLDLAQLALEELFFGWNTAAEAGRDLLSS